MNLETRLRTILLTGCFLMLLFNPPQAAFGQGEFQNLDFESPVLPLISVPNSSYPFVYISNAVPGWAAYLANDQQLAVLYNKLFLDTAVVAFEGPGSQYSAIDGSYSVVLQAGVYLSTANHVGASVAQTGMIPSDAHSLRFLATGYPTASFNGQTLSLVPLVGDSSPNTITLYGADISAFTGQTGELRFSAPYRLPIGSFNWVFLDDIQFSPEVVPEPSTYGLLVLGSLLLGWRSRKQRFN